MDGDCVEFPIGVKLFRKKNWWVVAREALTQEVKFSIGELRRLDLTRG